MALIRSGFLDHRWQRARVLADYQAGLLKRDELTDADFILTTAAKFHGEPKGGSSFSCPVCEKTDVREVLWVHGEELGRASGSARSWEEIEEFARRGLSFEVHLVEVCPDCGWNYLLTQETVHWED
ncbi:MAG: DUF5318 family protein [Corynebacterium sp.]|nr:DUF5318 family protein [Corynebacterium sp.]